MYEYKLDVTGAGYFAVYRRQPNTYNSWEKLKTFINRKDGEDYLKSVSDLPIYRKNT